MPGHTRGHERAENSFSSFAPRGKSKSYQSNHLKQTKQLSPLLHGIVGINITPFHPDRSVDFDALGRNLDFLLAGGIRVITPCGNTGEFSSLTVDECLEIMSFASKQIKGKAA